MWPRVEAAQLRQPHVSAFGDEHRARHPGLIGGKFFVFLRGRLTESRYFCTAHECRPLLWTAARARRIELRPDSQLFFAQNFAGHEQQAVEGIADQRLPQAANDFKLLAQRSRAQRGQAQQVKQIHGLRAG